MAHPADTRPVVVGLDWSEPARLATAVAAQEARQRGVGLRVVHAFSYPWMWPSWGDERESVVSVSRPAARRLLQRTAEQLRGSCPDLDVATSLVEGHAAAVLIDRC